MSDDRQALGWIVEVFRRAGVPFQAVGGLAARTYGARRPLADLDFYVPSSRLDDVADATAPYVSRLPSHHRDECWDLTFMKLDYDGRAIEVGGADGARYFDRQAGLWREARIRFDGSVERTIFGIRLPVMPRAQLIEYKQRLDRDVDRQDITEMATGLHGSPRDAATGKGRDMIEQHYIDDSLLQLQKLKGQADKALGQTEPEHLFAVLDAEANSIAVIMKHVAGNMRSRWTDFLTTDGEKPDRDRDREFILDAEDTRANILAAWEDGWSRVFAAVSALTPEDLGRTVTIRGEAHTVIEAINRQVTHYAAHVGQIVLLAKHYAGPSWQSLSIPRGKSKEFDVSRSGRPYSIRQDGGPHRS